MALKPFQERAQKKYKEKNHNNGVSQIMVWFPDMWKNDLYEFARQRREEYKKIIDKALPEAVSDTDQDISPFQ
jgi:Cu/Ag efflux pump CusA